MYAALIYDRMNVLVRVEERPTEERANKAGEFFTFGHKGYWWKVVKGEEEIDMYKAMINF